MSNNITISDVAEALGVSKTTVSRAISGKGRIGAATRKRVLEYIQEHDYKPNVIARGLAQSKTFNICVVMPGIMHLSICLFPGSYNGDSGDSRYDGIRPLLCIGSGNDMAGLRRIIQNHKVDGVVLLRTMVDDPQVTFLQERRIPFVTAGSCKYKDVKQIDHDHKSACRELTSIMLMRGMKIWRFSVEARILL